MHPRTGARLILDLDATAASTGIRYQVACYTPDRLYRGTADIALSDGRVDLGGWDPAVPPEWLVELARAFLRSEWRARKGAEPPPWPARVSRWRAER